MSRRKSKRKYRVIRIDAGKPKKSRKNWVIVILGFLATVVGVVDWVRNSDIDRFNVALIGGGIIVVWIAFRFSGFQNKHLDFLYVFQKRWIWWPVLLILILGTLKWAYFAKPKSPPDTTNREIIAKIQDSNKDISKAISDATETIQDSGSQTTESIDKGNIEILRRIDKLTELAQSTQKNSESYLDSEYPLGYVMVACSGEQKAVIYDRSRIDGDFNGIRVSEVHHSGLRVMELHIPGMWVQLGNETMYHFKEMRIGAEARAGEKQKFLFNSTLMQLELITAQPIGLVAVLGFREACTEEKLAK